MKKYYSILITLGIFTLAAFFRLYGVNWDQGQHLHPDERFLTMVTNAISWPYNLWEYLDSKTSPLNPQNRGFGFFVYGTFPIFFTKWVADLLGKNDYGNLTLLGRQLSALFDLGTVVLVFLIGKEILRNNPINTNKYQSTNKRNKLEIGLFSAFLYAAMVLPIQLSHFYAVDTYLTFFITLSFYLLIKIINLKFIGNWKLEIGNYAILLGIAFGLALASKITALLFLPIIGLGLFIAFIRHKNLSLSLVQCLMLSVICFLTFRLAQPYLFANPNLLDLTLNNKVVDNWKQLKSFDDVNGGFPPAVQWITTKPYLFPLKNTIYWGLGVPLGVIAILAISYRLWVIGYEFMKKKFDSQLNLILLWILLLFVYQGGQFVKALRYFYPLYPFLAILSGYFIATITEKINKKYNSKIDSFVYLFICLLVILYPLAFVSIYSRPHSRVAASVWIYQNIPAGSVKSDEHWDDALPLSLPAPGFIHEKYKGLEFPLYWPDTGEKWDLMIKNIKKVDYIIITSNRLYGSLTTVPGKFPVTYRYYQALFDGLLGFEKVAEFTSRPNLPIPFVKWCVNLPGARYGTIAQPSQSCDLPGISLVDDYADETFTVYDHPKVIIFKKVKEVDYRKILDI